MNKQLVTIMLLWFAAFAGSLIGTIKGIENHALWLSMAGVLGMAGAAFMGFDTLRKRNAALVKVRVRANNRRS